MNHKEQKEFIASLTNEIKGYRDEIKELRELVEAKNLRIQSLQKEKTELNDHANLLDHQISCLRTIVSLIYTPPLSLKKTYKHAESIS